MSPSESLPTTRPGSRQLMSTEKPPDAQKERSNSSSSSETSIAKSVDMHEEPAWPKEWQAYRTLMGCFFLMFNSWGLVNAYGTFSSFYMESLMPDIPIYLLNLIGSTESFVVLVLSFAVGRLLDAGFSRYLLGAGAFFVSLGMFMLSLTSGSGGRGEGNFVLIWVTQGLTQGLGMACFFVASSQIASTWFIRRKSFAIGIVASGASIAGLVYPIMTKYLITSLGFNNAVRAVGGLVAGTSLISFFCAIPNPAHPLNKESEYSWGNVRRWIDPNAFKNATFNWFCASIAFMFFGFYAIFFNLEEWAYHQKLGVKSSTGKLGNDFGRTAEPNSSLRTWMYLSVMNAASTIGRMLSGWLSDHYGALNVHFIVMFVSSILLYVWWTLASNVSSAFGFVVVFGAVSGAVIGLPPATVANIITRSPGVDHSRLGQWTGMMYTLASPFALTGPVIAGYLIKRFDNYLTVQMWSATCLFMASLCLLAAMISADRIEKRSSRFTGFFSSAVNSVWSKDEEKADGQVPTRVPSTRDQIGRA
ncbi:MFS general substrate transporter [Venturia nashicola]|nr:MFS general substrate transporter [Venturia nashicola]